MNIHVAMLIKKLMILTKYALKFAVRLTEQFITVGFITLRFYCTTLLWFNFLRILCLMNIQNQNGFL